MAAFAGGCAAASPSTFPAAPLEVDLAADGTLTRQYDTNRDGQPDYCERLTVDGRVTSLRLGGSGATAEEVLWPPVGGDVPNLIIIVDSVPFELVQQMQQQGRFRLFARPSRVISPFPVMTDVSLTEFFGLAPVPGVEAQFLDGDRLTNGATSYLSQRNMPWLSRVDYGLIPIGHALAYTNPLPWYEHELAQIEQRGLEALVAGRDYVGYSVGTSALGSILGRNGHHLALVRLDRLCHSLVQRTRGRIQITLMSDHGHDLRPSRWFSLAGAMRMLGYRVGARLGPGVDLVIPEWGMVSCAAVHTRNPSPAAADLTGIDGVDLAAYLDSDHDAVVVLGRGGRARIERTESGYRYQTEFGDPLAMLPILSDMGRLDSDGLGGRAAAPDWYDATVEGAYPDAVHRLWRAFHGLIRNTPDVLVSLRDGYHTGSESIKHKTEMAATHGNLGPHSTMGFVMTTAGALPPVVRMESLAGELRAQGVPVPEGPRRTVDQRQRSVPPIR
jgi:hypothetical protein